MKDNSFEIGKHRIEAFSDGVIAIIITLMVFNVKFPDIDNGASGMAFWTKLSNVFPHLLAYILSFTLLGVYWVNHHHFFHSLTSIDRNILWWNLNLLFWLSIIPLPTDFLALHPTKPEATALYAFNVFAASLSFTLMGRYAKTNKLMHQNISRRRKTRLARMNTLGITLYIISIFAGFLSVYISYIIFFIVPAMYFIPQKIEMEEPVQTKNPEA